MKVAAFSTLSGAVTVYRATGVKPKTFPPETVKTFQSSWLEGFDFLYFHLHGFPKQPFWYGDRWNTAISDAQVRRARLDGAIVFAANCYGQGSRMVEALYRAGASVIVAGPGSNEGGKGGRLRGADRLGARFIVHLGAGETAYNALQRAKHDLRWWALLFHAERDALEFQIQGRV